MKIITLTLSPAYDTHCSVDCFKPYHENIAAIDCIEAGGKGVNLSRALTFNNIDNLALIVVGNENGEVFTRRLQADGLNFKTITTQGRIRENITLHSNDGKDETRICFNGFCLNEDILTKISDGIGAVDENTIITMTGSVPKGITVRTICDFLTPFKEKGAKIVIDSRSFAFDDLAYFKPWLCKPNVDEAALYTGITVNGISDGVKVATMMHDAGIENLLLSLGKDGAVLANSEGVFHANAPSINALSTIGAGDSMIAGFIAAFSKGLSTKDCLKQAVSYGSAACLEQGTRPPDPTNVEILRNQITVTKLN